MRNERVIYDSASTRSTGFQFRLPRSFTFSHLSRIHNDMYYRILLNCFDIANSCWNIIAKVTRTLAEMDVTNVALSSIYSRAKCTLAFEGINCATYEPISAVARHFMIILTRKRYYARQSHYPKLQNNNIFINNIFINGPWITNYRLSRIAIFRCAQSFETSVLLANRSLSALARHDPNEVPAPTNCAISLNLGGTEPPNPRSHRTYTSRDKKERACEQGGEKRKRKEEKESRELLIRRRARIPCRCISDAVIMAKRSLIPRKREREEGQRERKSERESMRAAHT